VFGDDPTVKALESRVAALFDKEAACFVPTGTQGNLISLMAHCWERGSEYIVGDQAHVYIFEQGGAAQFGGAHPRALVTSSDGTIGDAATCAAAIRTSDQHFPITRVLALENTHNLCGGKVLTTEYVSSVADAMHERGVALHLDAARVWHAATHQGESLQTVGAPADTLSVCLSKALGAPAGSLMVGSGELVARGRRLRKGLGGTSARSADPRTIRTIRIGPCPRTRRRVA
jgi:threonine aldolase